jgi:hypothetical protein
VVGVDGDGAVEVGLRLVEVLRPPWRGLRRASRDAAGRGKREAQTWEIAWVTRPLLQMVLTCPPRAAAVTTRRARAAPRGAATERAAGARLRGHVMFTLTKVTTFIRGGGGQGAGRTWSGSRARTRSKMSEAPVKSDRTCARLRSEGNGSHRRRSRARRCSQWRGGAGRACLAEEGAEVGEGVGMRGVERDRAPHQLLRQHVVLLHLLPGTHTLSVTAPRNSEEGKAAAPGPPRPSRGSAATAGRGAVRARDAPGRKGRRRRGQ